MGMGRGRALGTRIRISEEIMKTLKCTTCLVTISFVIFRLVTVLWLAILQARSDVII